MHGTKPGTRGKDTLESSHREANMEQNNAMEKVLQGPKGKMYRAPMFGEKRLHYLRPLSKDNASLQTNLTWVPRNGKKIKIWQDSIMGDIPLELETGFDTTQKLDGNSKINLSMGHLHLGE
jgi:hypothetical protein